MDPILEHARLVVLTDTDRAYDLMDEYDVENMFLDIGKVPDGTAYVRLAKDFDSDFLIVMIAEKAAEIEYGNVYEYPGFDDNNEMWVYPGLDRIWSGYRSQGVAYVVSEQRYNLNTSSPDGPF